MVKAFYFVVVVFRRAMKLTALGLARISSLVKNSPPWGVFTRYKILSTLQKSTLHKQFFNDRHSFTMLFARLHDIA